MKIKRGDIFYANLNPTMDSEQGGIRPVLIIQNDIGNKVSPNVIVAAISSKFKNSLPTHVALDESVLFMKSVVLLEQISTISKNRLMGYIGSVKGKKMHMVDESIRISLGVTQKEKEIVK